MTKKDLENKISELERQVAELKEELKKQNSKIPVGKIWKPEKGEQYYFNYFGGVTDAHYNDLDDLDVSLMQAGNCYQTKEKAEFETQREKYTRLFRQYVEQHSEPLDWNNEVQVKYCIYYDNVSQRIDYQKNAIFSVLSSVYASSEEVLKEAIDFVGEENVKKYILEIGEKLC